MYGESERPPHEGAEPGLDPEQRGHESSAVGVSEQKRLSTEGSRTRQSGQFLDEGGSYVQDQGTDKPRLEVSEGSIESRRNARANGAEVLRQVESLGFKEGDPIEFTWDTGMYTVSVKHESGTFLKVDANMLTFNPAETGLPRMINIALIRSINRPFP